MPQINVDQAVSIGHSQFLDFERIYLLDLGIARCLTLPAGYWNTIERKIMTMATTKKGIAIGPKVLYDSQLIFSILGLQASSRQLTSKVFSLTNLHQFQLHYLITQV